MKNNPQLKFSALTLFPELFEGFVKYGVIGKAIEKGELDFEGVNLRDFVPEKHPFADDRPVGGGDGMVLKADIAQTALDTCLTPNSTVIHLTPAGKTFDNHLSKELAKSEHIVFLCGRYAGFDHRFVQRYAHHEVSIGDFVLSGGEHAAICMMDSISRFVPGVLGNADSAVKDSFEDGLLEAPSYTKPDEFMGLTIPDVLKSGNHKKIEKYRRMEQIKRTALNRPDIVNLNWDTLTKSERALAERIWKYGSGKPKT